MTLTEHLDAIAEKLGVDNLPDRLLTTYLEAFAKSQGVDVSSLQDKLVTTYLAAILNARGGKSVRDNLVTTYLEEISKTFGVDELIDHMIATYLKEIADAIEGGGGSGETGGGSGGDTGGSGGDDGGEEPEPDVPTPDVPSAYDKYSWEGVAASINAGTYATDYAIGDMVPLDLGSEGVINMQVAAFDKDDLADGSGKAPITFVAKELLATKRRMNPSYSAGTEGTGAIGGWEKCEMRAYLQNTIKPLIPEGVADLICTVTKTQAAYDTAGTKFTQTTADEVWIPTIIGTATAEYSELFSVSGKVKRIVGDESATAWWTRLANSSSNFNYYSTSGKITNRDASGGPYGVCLGFCTGKTKT